MARKKQSRRSISVRGLTYQRVKNYCEKREHSISGYLETLIAADLDRQNFPVPERIEPPAKTPPDVEEIASQHFTF